MKAKVIIALAMAACSPISAALADDADCCCPRCQVRCVPSREIEQRERTAYDVECKWICVPKIRFPWEPCCQPQCAWVRKVKVLKKTEYECPHCKYKWTAVCDCPACQGGPCAAGQAEPQTHPLPAPPAQSEAASRRLFPPLRSLFGESIR
jgi:hypothetical protein